VLTEYHAHEMGTVNERSLRNAFKFGTTGEIDSKEGEASVEGLIDALSNVSEVEAPQGELNGAVGEALVPQPSQQCLRTKLVFDVRIDNQLLD